MTADQLKGLRTDIDTLCKLRIKMYNIVGTVGETSMNKHRAANAVQAINETIRNLNQFEVAP